MKAQKHIVPSKITDATVRRFFDKVLPHPPETLDEDYEFLCEEWRAATGAEWIWMWMLHQDDAGDEVMQLVGRSTSVDETPPQTRIGAPKSAAAYCAKTGNVVIVKNDNFEDWEELDEKGHYYTVTMAKELRSMGCKKFICVPILMPPAGARKARKQNQSTPIITAVVCIHFRTVCDLGEESQVRGLLASMGHATAQSLLSTYQTLQLNILFALEKLAHRYLTLSTGDLLSIQKRYASAVIKVIQDFLSVRGVSLFFRDTLRGGVQCLGSTGLMTADGKSISDPVGIHYAATDGRTGECFRTGLPMVFVKGMSDKKKSKTVESMEGMLHLDRPATIFPIPLPVGVSETPNSLGVIRCKFHASKIFPNIWRCFDPVELQSLGFIARQIAPVLDTMELNIARERVVSVTKHDLYAPIGTIRRKIFDLRTNKDILVDKDYMVVHRYDLNDIGICTMMCLNTVAQLDKDPRNFIPDAVIEYVSVEGAIVAPIKGMLAQYAQDASGMKIQYDGVDRFPSLWLDQVLIHRALFNLISNAIKYGQKHSRISIAGTSDHGHYHLEVRNEGIGIAHDEESKVFAPGFRSARTQHLAIGVGLGLCIARKCVENCGCHLILKSGQNPTVFRISIPYELSNPDYQKINIAP